MGEDRKDVTCYVRLFVLIGKRCDMLRSRIRVNTGKMIHDTLRCGC